MQAVNSAGKSQQSYHTTENLQVHIRFLINRMRESSRVI